MMPNVLSAAAPPTTSISFDCSLNRWNVNIWIAGSDHNGLRSECRLPTRNQCDQGENTRRMVEKFVEGH